MAPFLPSLMKSVRTVSPLVGVGGARDYQCFYSALVACARTGLKIDSRKMTNPAIPIPKTVLNDWPV